MIKFLLILIFVRPILGVVALSVADSRNMTGGFWWGFFLGVLGIIIVAFRPKDDSNTITPRMVVYCKKCKKISKFYYVCKTCGLPMTETTISWNEWNSFSDNKKEELLKAFSKGQYLTGEDNVYESVDNRSESISVERVADDLKKLKELLDSGILTQEEFDAKKKQLLGL